MNHESFDPSRYESISEMPEEQKGNFETISSAPGEPEQFVRKGVFETQKRLEKDPESWGGVKNFINVAVAALVLNLATPGIGEAAPGSKDIQTLKNKIEAAKVVTYKIEKQLIELVSAKGDLGKIGDQPVKRLKGDSSWTIEVGYNKDMSKAEWTIVGSPNGSISLIDRNNDGFIDRYIINDEKEKPWVKSADNLIHLFADTKSLDETVPIEIELSSATPSGKNNVEIGSFINKNNNITFHSYDMKSGEIIDDNSSLASEFAYNMQSRFHDALKDSVNKYK